MRRKVFRYSFLCALLFVFVTAVFMFTACGKEETVKEKNCLDINTQFYTNYSVTESGNNVTVSVPSPSEDKYEIIAASYSNGVLTNAAKKSKSDVTSDKTVTFENIKKNENDTVKVFFTLSF